LEDNFLRTQPEECRGSIFSNEHVSYQQELYDATQQLSLERRLSSKLMERIQMKKEELEDTIATVEDLMNQPNASPGRHEQASSSVKKCKVDDHALERGRQISHYPGIQNGEYDESFCDWLPSSKQFDRRNYCAVTGQQFEENDCPSAPADPDEISAPIPPRRSSNPSTGCVLFEKENDGMNNIETTNFDRTSAADRALSRVESKHQTRLNQLKCQLDDERKRTEYLVEQMRELEDTAMKIEIVNKNLTEILEESGRHGCFAGDEQHTREDVTTSESCCIQEVSNLPYECQNNFVSNAGNSAVPGLACSQCSTGLAMHDHVDSVKHWCRGCVTCEHNDLINDKASVAMSHSHIGSITIHGLQMAPSPSIDKLGDVPNSNYEPLSSQQGCYCFQESEPFAENSNATSASEQNNSEHKEPTVTNCMRGEPANSMVMEIGQNLHLCPSYNSYIMSHTRARGSIRREHNELIKDNAGETVSRNRDGSINICRTQMAPSQNRDVLGVVPNSCFECLGSQQGCDCSQESRSCEPPAKCSTAISASKQNNSGCAAPTQTNCMRGESGNSTTMSIAQDFPPTSYNSFKMSNPLYRSPQYDTNTGNSVFCCCHNVQNRVHFSSASQTKPNDVYDTLKPTQAVKDNVKIKISASEPLKNATAMFPILKQHVNSETQTIFCEEHGTANNSDLFHLRCALAYHQDTRMGHVSDDAASFARCSSISDVLDLSNVQGTNLTSDALNSKAALSHNLVSDHPFTSNQPPSRQTKLHLSVPLAEDPTCSAAHHDHHAPVCGSSTEPPISNHDHSQKMHALSHHDTVCPACADLNFFVPAEQHNHEICDRKYCMQCNQYQPLIPGDALPNSVDTESCVKPAMQPSQHIIPTKSKPDCYVPEKYNALAQNSDYLRNSTHRRDASCNTQVTAPHLWAQMHQSENLQQNQPSNLRMNILPSERDPSKLQDLFHSINDDPASHYCSCHHHSHRMSTDNNYYQNVMDNYYNHCSHCRYHYPCKCHGMSSDDNTDNVRNTTVCHDNTSDNNRSLFTKYQRPENSTSNHPANTESVSLGYKAMTTLESDISVNVGTKNVDQLGCSIVKENELKVADSNNIDFSSETNDKCSDNSGSGSGAGLCADDSGASWDTSECLLCANECKVCREEAHVLEKSFLSADDVRILNETADGAVPEISSSNEEICALFGEMTFPEYDKLSASRSDCDEMEVDGIECGATQTQDAVMSTEAPAWKREMPKEVYPELDLKLQTEAQTLYVQLSTQCEKNIVAYDCTPEPNDEPDISGLKNDELDSAECLYEDFSDCKQD